MLPRAQLGTRREESGTDEEKRNKRDALPEKRKPRESLRAFEILNAVRQTLMSTDRRLQNLILRLRHGQST